MTEVVLAFLGEEELRRLHLLIVVQGRLLLAHIQPVVIRLE